MIALLPKYLLLNLLKEWLFLREIGKLDTVLCNHECRVFFHAQISNCELSFCHEFGNTSEMKLLSWIVVRNFNANRLFLKEKSDQKPKISVLLKNHKFNSLKHIKLSCGPGYKSFKLLFTRATNLEGLEINDASIIGVKTIAPILKLCSDQMKYLTFSGVHIDDWTRHDMNCFKYIRELILCKCFFSSETITMFLSTLDDGVTVPNFSKLRVDKRNTSMLGCKFLMQLHTESVCFLPLPSSGVFNVTWLKQTTSNNRNVITVSTSLPIDELNYVCDESTVPMFVLKGYDNRNLAMWAYTDCDNIVVVHLKIVNCYFTFGYGWLPHCYLLKHLTVKDSSLTPEIDGFCQVTRFSMLCKLTIIDIKFDNVEIWLRALLAQYIPLLKQVGIIVPTEEMKEIGVELADKLNTIAVTYTVKDD